MQKWEYAQIHFVTGQATLRITYSHQSERVDAPSDSFWARVREMGDQGWELTGVTATGDNPTTLRHWFKRAAAGAESA